MINDKRSRRELDVMVNLEIENVKRLCRARVCIGFLEIKLTMFLANIFTHFYTQQVLYFPTRKEQETLSTAILIRVATVTVCFEFSVCPSTSLVFLSIMQGLRNDTQQIAKKEMLSICKTYFVCFKSYNANIHYCINYI